MATRMGKWIWAQSLVPGGRVELPWCYHRRILSPLRLPFRHPGLEGGLYQNDQQLAAFFIAYPSLVPPEPVADSMQRLDEFTFHFSQRVC